MSKITIPIQKCLRHLMKMAHSTSEANSLIRNSGWCVRFCQDGCMKDAQKRCLSETDKTCKRLCKNKCIHMGHPPLPSQDVTHVFLYPNK
jgi:hypothetical protein